MRPALWLALLGGRWSTGFHFLALSVWYPVTCTSCRRRSDIDAAAEEKDEDIYSDLNRDDVRINSPLQTSSVSGPRDEFSLHLPTQ